MSSRFKKIAGYFDRLVKIDTKESSKRFLAIYLTLGPITFIVLAYTSRDNVLLVLAELVAFATGLLYVASREKRNPQNNNDNETASTKRDNPSTTRE